MNNQEGKKRYDILDEEIARYAAHDGFKSKGPWANMYIFWTLLWMNLKEIVKDNAVEELKELAVKAGGSGLLVIEQEDAKDSNQSEYNFAKYTKEKRAIEVKEVKSIKETCELLILNAETIIEEANKAAVGSRKDIVEIIERVCERSFYYHLSLEAMDRNLVF